MSESIILPETTDKESRYDFLFPQLQNLLEGEPNREARCANFTAFLKEAFHFFWVGFYWVDTPEELVLGTFQGSLACMRIRYGRGVCGTAWKDQNVLIVPDVNQFPGHIACSSLSRSELVIPIIRQGKVIGVLDIDSEKLNDFDTVDALWLHKMLKVVLPD